MAGIATVTQLPTEMQIVDSHTGGEPTRVILEGGPDFGRAPFAERLMIFGRDFDSFRRMAINEPRGCDAMVGALLCQPDDSSCATGVIFFNNTGYLGMCGHAAIGLAVTLHHLNRIPLGTCRLQTPVGVVEVNLLDANLVTIENVPSYRFRKQVAVQVEGLGQVVGDVAWGGNWFFLVESSPIRVSPANIPQLTDATTRIRRALQFCQITGAEGAEIDHIELFGKPSSGDANSRNFVLCPGGAYDRSPCGTGTSAKLACLAADNKLQPGETWVQESIIGSRFDATYRCDSDHPSDFSQADRIIPIITGSAFVCGEGRLIGHAGDGFRYGIPVKVTA